MFVNFLTYAAVRVDGQLNNKFGVKGNNIGETPIKFGVKDNGFGVLYNNNDAKDNNNGVEVITILV
jgi:hypothetical protein